MARAFPSVSAWPVVASVIVSLPLRTTCAFPDLSMISAPSPPMIVPPVFTSTGVNAAASEEPDELPEDQFIFASTDLIWSST